MMKTFVSILLLLSFAACKKVDATIEKNYGYPLRFGIEPDETIIGEWENMKIGSIEKTSFSNYCAVQGVPESRLIQAKFNSLTLIAGAESSYPHSDLSLFDSLELYLDVPGSNDIFLGSISAPFQSGVNYWNYIEQDLLDNVIADDDDYLLRYKKKRVVDSTEVFTIRINYALKTD